MRTILITSSLLGLLILLGTCAVEAQDTIFANGFESGTVCLWSASQPDGCQLDAGVSPTLVDDVLTNPGMGFADFHFGWWCNLPPVTFPRSPGLPTAFLCQ